ncbi:MAG: DNA replication and repair protein recF [uncultured bacterium]|nr:MAG: DNA replication and repair protein recF [uncultured bacterium]
MLLSSIKLQNFRNYDVLKKTFNKKVVVFIGENTQGKTNMIEAIRFLSLFKSFRTSAAGNVIGWNCGFARVEGEIKEGRVKKSIVGMLLKDDVSSSVKRMTQINGTKTTSSDAVGEFLTVLFSPEDIRLVSSSPVTRRKYIDSVLGQVSKVYYNTLLHYNRALEQRNKLISNMSKRYSPISSLFIWDEQLAEQGSHLVKKRSEFFEKINKKLDNFYKEISGENAKLKVIYIPKVNLPGVETLIDKKELGKFIKRSLKAAQANDLARQTTTIGPHRDDFAFELNDRSLATFGSRGEFRSAVLALKLAELSFLEDASGKKPVLLLDDVFSELDKSRRRCLGKVLNDHQVFITATDVNEMDDEFKKGALFLKINGGKIVKIK